MPTIVKQITQPLNVISNHVNRSDINLSSIKNDFLFQNFNSIDNLKFDPSALDFIYCIAIII